jgi:hypothetical protein
VQLALDPPCIAIGGASTKGLFCMLRIVTARTVMPQIHDKVIVPDGFHSRSSFRQLGALLSSMMDRVVRPDLKTEFTVRPRQFQEKFNQLLARIAASIGMSNTQMEFSTFQDMVRSALTE